MNKIRARRSRGLVIEQDEIYWYEFDNRLKCFKVYSRDDKDSYLCMFYNEDEFGRTFDFDEV